MKRFSIILALSVGCSAASALPIAESFLFSSGFQNGGAVPDGDPTGLADLRTVSSSITGIDSVEVSFHLEGGWSGDIYASLQHSSGFAVLLNRVGRTAGNAFGFGDAGFNVTFSDLGGFSDIHAQTAGGGMLTGTFASDGRNVDPSGVLDSDARTALLDSFAGLGAAGDWTLFVADLVGGDAHTLESWSLEITGTAGGTSIPDAGSSAWLLVVAATGLAGMRRGSARRSLRSGLETQP